MTRTTQEELTHFLSDLYSVELQALAQLETAPGMAGDPVVAEYYRKHRTETERQAELVRGRLEAHGGSPSAVKDAVMKLGGKGFLLFAKLQSETPGRLLVHSYSYEAMEWAGYALLARLAERAGDAETLETARRIQGEEREMMRRLEEGFDAAEASAHEELGIGEMPDHIRSHLAEAHALVCQGIKIYERAGKNAHHELLAGLYDRALKATKRQADALENRVKTLGSDVSTIEDAAMKLGGLNWTAFFQSQADTPGKLLAFAYAVEHLQIGGLELLQRTARRGCDETTERLCERVIAEKRSTAGELADHVVVSVEATLEVVAG